jgi:hypothetical protein
MGDGISMYSKLNIPLFQYSNIDGLVKSRLAGENRCPVFSLELDSPHQVRGRPAGVYPDENRGRNDEIAWIPAGVYPALRYGAGMTVLSLFQLFTTSSTFHGSGS